MPTITRHTPNTFCWIDLMTTDPSSAKQFYGPVFGWTFEDLPTPNGPAYSMAKMQAADICALSGQPPEMKQAGAPSMWNCYVAVDDVEAMTQKAVSLGGKAMVPAFDVMDAGRMSVIADPSGAMLSLWQAKKHIGASRTQDPGTMSWNELMTTNVDASGSFLSKLFGWRPDVQAMGNSQYTTWMLGTTRVAGMVQMPKSAGAAPSSWMTYLAVGNVDATLKLVTKAGGKIALAAQDVPGVGRWALAQDPQGATFGLLTLQLRN